MTGSNPRHLAYKANALPTELHRRACAAHRSCDSRSARFRFASAAPGVDPTRGHGGLRRSDRRDRHSGRLLHDGHRLADRHARRGDRVDHAPPGDRRLGERRLRRRQPTGADHATGRSLRGQHLRQRRAGDRPDRAVRSGVLHRPGVALPRPALDGRVLRPPDRRALPGLVAHPPGPRLRGAGRPVRSRRAAPGLATRSSSRERARRTRSAPTSTSARSRPSSSRSAGSTARQCRPSRPTTPTGCRSWWTARTPWRASCGWAWPASRRSGSARCRASPTSPPRARSRWRRATTAVATRPRCSTSPARWPRSSAWCPVSAPASASGSSWPAPPSAPRRSSLPSRPRPSPSVPTTRSQCSTTSRAPSTSSSSRSPTRRASSRGA